MITWFNIPFPGSRAQRADRQRILWKVDRDTVIQVSRAGEV